MVPKNNRALRLHLGHNGTDFSCFPPDRSFKLPALHFSSTTIGGVQKQQKTIIRRTQQMRNRFRGLLCIQSVFSLPHTHTHTLACNSALSGTRHSLYHYIHYSHSLSLSLSHALTIYPSLVHELTVGTIYIYIRMHRGEFPQKSVVSLFCRKNRYRLL